ncbi:DUF2892 domain-containing protein (plasmid) [Thioclava sp. GXIMD4216]
MTRNMGKTDRALRVIVAVVLLVLAIAGILPAGLLKILAVIVALVFIVTSLIGTCPLYTIVGIRTCPRS